MTLSRWTKNADGSWIADGIRGTWALTKDETNWWELVLYREDLSSRMFGRYRDFGEAKTEAWKFDERGN